MNQKYSIIKFSLLRAHKSCLFGLNILFLVIMYKLKKAVFSKTNNTMTMSKHSRSPKTFLFSNSLKTFLGALPYLQSSNPKTEAKDFIYLRIRCTLSMKGCSQAYIFTVRIPEMMEFIMLMRLSATLEMFDRSFPQTLPIAP